MSVADLHCDEVRRMFFVSRGNSVARAIRISKPLNDWVKKFCEENGISFNYLIRLLLLNLYVGNIRVTVNKPIIISKSNIVVNEKNSVNKYLLRAEKILMLCNKNYERYLQLEKMDKHKMDYYTRKEFIKNNAMNLIDEIEKIIDNIIDIEKIEKLKEQHKLQLKIYQELTR